MTIVKLFVYIHEKLLINIYLINKIDYRINKLYS